MSRNFSILSVACLLVTGPLFAAGPKAPYEAVVTAENATLHSGPKKDKFYTTGMIPQGTRVMVHRQDPGGWFMIEPPPGCFSWIQAKHVEVQGDIGTVTANNVRVQVGTPDSDRHDVSQRRLNTGDEVQILGQKVLPASPTGEAEVWYKITPPHYEWRWVMGKNLTPADQVATQTSTKRTQRTTGRPAPQESTPLRAPQPLVDNRPVASADPREPVAAMAFNTLEAPEGDEVAAPYSATTEVEHADAEQPGVPVEAPSILAALDEEFARLMDLEDGPQDFTALEAGYREARAKASNPGTQRLIDRRLATIRSLTQEAAAAKVFGDGPEQMAAEQDEAQRRDAELAAKQAEIEARLAGLEQRFAAPRPQQSQPQPLPADAWQPQPVPQPAPGIALPQRSPAVTAPSAEHGVVQSSYETGRPPAPLPKLESQLQPAPHAQVPAQMIPQQMMTRKLHPRFDGAGIVQTAPAGSPAPYLLTARDGRVLAFLLPQPGVNLQSFVGKPVGIHGARAFSPQIRADEIRVTGLEPVRLK